MKTFHNRRLASGVLVPLSLPHPEESSLRSSVGRPSPMMLVNFPPMFIAVASTLPKQHLLWWGWGRASRR